MNTTIRAVLIALAMALALGIAFGSAAHVSAQGFAAGDEVVVFDGALNLREAPGLDAAVLEVLPDAAPLTVLAGPEAADDIDWYQVSTADASEGWVTGEFITFPSASGEFAAGDVVVVANGPLNLRDSAGTDAAVIDTLADGATGTVLEGPTSASGYAWYQIETSDAGAGWVVADFIALDTDGDAFAAGDEVIVAQGPLNLRETASVDAAVIETLDEGATASVVSGPVAAGDYTWYEITVTDGETGFAAGEFLALADGAAPVDVDFPIGSFVFVDSDTINLRADAGLDAEILDTLSDGNIATVLDGPVAADDFTWFQVSIGDGDAAQEGWLAGQLLSGGVVLGADAAVADGPLNLREEASPDATAVTQLEAGETINVVSGPTTAGGQSWFEVTAGEDTGFVAGRYLGPVDAEVQAETVEPETEAEGGDTTQTEAADFEPGTGD